LQLQVILFLILGGFLFMNHRNEWMWIIVNQ
jgi:hypothetical protein